MSINYYTTNESLQAVVEGMDIKPEDDILAVCGSGHQAIAMIEYANSVTANDKNPAQVEYARKEIGIIRAKEQDFSAWQGNNEYILPLSRQNIAYLLQPGRLEKIKGRLERITLKEGRLKPGRKGRFSKAYLSNIIGYEGEPFILLCKFRLWKLARSLREPGLIYIANGDHMYDFGRRSIESIMPQNMVLDQTLTGIARKHEAGNASIWRPTVFRRKT